MPGVVYQGTSVGFRRLATGVLLHEGDPGYNWAHPDDKAPVDDSTECADYGDGQAHAGPAAPAAEAEAPMADGSSPTCNFISGMMCFRPGLGHACKGLLEIGMCFLFGTCNSYRFKQCRCEHAGKSEGLISSCIRRWRAAYFRYSVAASSHHERAARSSPHCFVVVGFIKCNDC